MKPFRAAAWALAACLAAGPAALAQNANPPQPASPPPQQQQQNADIGTATISPTGLPPSQRNPLLTDNGDVQIGKLIGTTIYNKNDQDIGSVKDVLASKSGQMQVVVSAGGKQVVVPWDKLEFGDAKLNSHNKVLMPDATEQSLASMPAFNPQNNNKKG